ncbi:hypothetical protein MCOR29_000361 [Pyricularia oryzae]|nr:hypothetical protein MCOR26_002270 [Pyricularia oryzae]KAI6335205.1 hypothetical protein MCOR29_000361 [Pyricularia oryzae]KAI6340445.1 hypothetical protein MCOR28_006618 [Pyricularia oryzae]KAI6357005.1 hypothetical protein MCOR31_010486 [Pyricularia oryzae]KAI6380538.1 hypothetical protein MCOR32_003930 [Pyricularia oryzae]
MSPTNVQIGDHASHDLGSTQAVLQFVPQNLTMALLHPEIMATVFPYIRAIQGDGTILFHEQHMGRVEEPVWTPFPWCLV